MAQATKVNPTITAPETVSPGLPHNCSTIIEEFSEPEDLMEGIRNVGKLTLRRFYWATNTFKEINC